MRFGDVGSSFTTGKKFTGRFASIRAETSRIEYESMRRDRVRQRGGSSKSAQRIGWKKRLERNARKLYKFFWRFFYVFFLFQVLPLRGDSTVELGADALLEKSDQVRIVRPTTKGKENMASKTIVTVDSSPTSSPSTRRKKSSRSGVVGSVTGGIPIPDKHKLDAYGGRGSPGRSPHGRRSPKPSSFAGSGDEFGQDRFDNRTTPKPIPGRMQPHRGTPIGSPDVIFYSFHFFAFLHFFNFFQMRSRGTDESPLSCSPASLGTSPWIRRRYFINFLIKKVLKLL